jgi:hypothetical protein
VLRVSTLCHAVDEVFLDVGRQHHFDELLGGLASLSTFERPVFAPSITVTMSSLRQ